MLHRLIARAHLPGSRWFRVARFGGALVVTSAALDAAENLVSFVMLANPTAFPAWLATLYSSLAAAKWTIALVGGPLLAVQVVALAATRRRDRAPAPARD